jgi:hypothetical protein
MSKTAPLAPRSLRGIVALALAGTCALALFARPARADENLFGFLYGSETLPQGKGEIYGWATLRSGKESGTYRGYDFSTEGEYGISDHFQGSLYLNFRGHEIEDVPGFENRSNVGFQGAQVALKYALLSPYEDPIGLALYFEPGYSHIGKSSGERVQEWEFETKVIAQKNFAEDRLVWAANGVIEQEFERESGGSADFEGELGLEFATGLSYRVASGWNVGVEGRTSGGFHDMDLSQHEEQAWFLGPNVHYGSKSWWFTLAHIRQVGGWPNTGTSDLQLDGFTKSETRLKLGVNL